MYFPHTSLTVTARCKSLQQVNKGGQYQRKSSSNTGRRARDAPEESERWPQDESRALEEEGNQSRLEQGESRDGHMDYHHKMPAAIKPYRMTGWVGPRSLPCRFSYPQSDGGPALPTASIGRGLSSHCTAVLCFDLFLEAGHRPLGAKKQLHSATCALALLPLGSLLLALHDSTIRWPDGQEPIFPWIYSWPCPPPSPEGTSITFRKPDFSQRLGSFYLLLGHSSNRSNVALSLQS